MSSSRIGATESKVVGFGVNRIDDGIGESRTFVRPSEVLFAFNAAALRAAGPDRQPIIVAKWTGELTAFPRNVVLLRTWDAIHASHVRTLREFKHLVRDWRFETLHRSVVANLENLHSVALGRQHVKTVTFSVRESDFSWPLEMVVVSRMNVQRIRELFAMPNRRRTRRARGPKRRLAYRSPPPTDRSSMQRW